MQTSNEPRDPADLLRLVREAYPVAVPPDDRTRLGRMLARLIAALEAAEAARSVSAAVRDDLVAMVPRLRRYAAALTADRGEADDLVQATLLKAWERRERLPPGQAMAAWLFATLRRAFLQEGQKERRRGRPEPSAAESAPDAATGSTTDERSAVRAALDRLTAAQREALLLVTVEGLPRPVAAGIVGRAAEAVTDDVDAAHGRLARDLGSS